MKFLKMIIKKLFGEDMNNAVKLSKKQESCDNGNDQRKIAFKRFRNFLVGLLNINIDNSNNYESNSEYAALMRRRDELYAYKMRIGYDEEKQREFENVNRRLQEIIKS